MRDRPYKTVWRKSTCSNGQGDCIEVAEGVTGIVPVRDSKDSHGPALVFSAEAWCSFVVGIRADDFPVGP
ncbi:DUF397 domain-containing protein [Streptomyces sp. CBMA156]|uniref:DUF397 domain-containing protein n=1 Tax=Streptomyces sp. CBMA156 TaxID=1930280 RepID=UPI0016620879|nr:DUF397 domain-containing protein [Streptomyces sp. CBMA156]MBD0672700.1 DUF397 domain-containing protein [Streptomyces sp. CBMA156]